MVAVMKFSQPSQLESKRLIVNGGRGIKNQECIIHVYEPIDEILSLNPEDARAIEKPWQLCVFNRYFECLASGLPADGGQAWAALHELRILKPGNATCRLEKKHDRINFTFHQPPKPLTPMDLSLEYIPCVCAYIGKSPHDILLDHHMNRYMNSGVTLG